ncbi:tetratricopeptide repeat protein [Clostridium akagii]|uniref:tetratricopeptide repeat protein n=1 Tax=Clostridium akagii TaxID=91623 RepID=UPI00047E2792|nr:tetratricopeptide repeat protein [Clostridium akagii]
MNYFNEANDYYNKMEYKVALNLYLKSAHLKENETASLYNAAVCLIKLGVYDKAIELLKKAISLKQDSRYFFNLGYCNVMLKDKKKALIYFNVAWSLDNSDSDCEKAISMITKSYKKNVI